MYNDGIDEGDDEASEENKPEVPHVGASVAPRMVEPVCSGGERDKLSHVSGTLLFADALRRNGGKEREEKSKNGGKFWEKMHGEAERSIRNRTGRVCGLYLSVWKVKCVVYIYLLSWSDS